jgi:thioredoxin 1
MLIERLIILAVVFLAGLLACQGWRWWLAHKAQRLAGQAVPDEVAKLLPAGPALLYFTTPTCAQCRFQQTPILSQLAQSTSVAIHTMDAVEHEVLASFYGIMTVPTTIWLDNQQRPTAINHGLAPLPQLHQQALALNLTV